MTDVERRRLIDDLCDAALQRDPSERAAFVAAASQGDEALRREVEALLAHAETAELFLATPIGNVAAEVLADRSARTLPGRQVGPYTILNLIGRGGMGEVYRARDTKLGRDVAFKVVAERFVSDATRLARLAREARVLATLNHPNIAAIYGVEEAGGIQGLVLELVEGQTLAERLAQAPLTGSEALKIARQIADALDAAHDKSIIHRDLKPANIKITADATVKVLDFGLAKVFSSEGPGTESSPVHASSITIEGTHEGVIAGTAAYMSPEQARGLPVDKRTDIWAFGCVLYEMLTGCVAFAAESFSDTIVKVCDSEPDWSRLPAHTAPGIRRLLRRCFEKETRRRLRDIGDARIEVDEALEGSAEPADTASRVPPAPSSPVDRAPRRLAWAAGALGLAIASATGAWYLAGSFQRKPPEDNLRDPLAGAKFTRLTDFRGAEHHAAISRDGKLVVFLWDGDGTWDAWLSQIGAGGGAYNLTKGRVQELRNPATRTLTLTPDASLVTLWSRVPDAVKGGLVNAFLAVSTLGGEPEPYLKAMPEGISELDWSPDGQRIVYHPPTAGDPLWVNNLDGKAGKKIFAAQEGDHCHFPVWSGDGKFIYFVRGAPPPLDEMDIWRIRPDGGEPERLTSHNARVSFPTLLDNRTLLYLATDEDGSGPWIYAMDVERRQFRRLITGDGEYTSLAASGDGHRIVATASHPTSTLWRVPIADRVIDESGASAISLQTANARSPRFGRGYVIYRAPIEGRIGLWKLSGGTATRLKGISDGALERAAISRDGQRIAFVVRRQGPWELYVMSADGKGVQRIAEDLDVRGTPAWSPDGRWLAVAAKQGGDPHLFKISVDGGQRAELVKEYALDPTWSPSGQFLVYSGADVGTTFSVKAVSADGTPHRLPTLNLSRGERRLVFPGRREDELLVLKGDISHKEFWRYDLRTGEGRQLTNLGRGFAIEDFDVSPDGREIIFDRIRDESDIVLFERPGAEPGQRPKVPGSLNKPSGSP